MWIREYQEGGVWILEEFDVATVTQCTACGIRTINQPEGDGCHNCLKGVMREVKI